MMPRILRIILGVVIIGGITAFIGYFADAPRYNYFAEDTAQIKLSLMHTGNRAEPCRRRTAEELAAMPANMRKPLDCSRDRVAVVVSISVDGVETYRESLAPTGLFGDGRARAYMKLVVPIGRHHIAVGIRDTARAEGFDYVRDGEFDLKPGQNLVIDFAASDGGIIFR